MNWANAFDKTNIKSPGPSSHVIIVRTHLSCLMFTRSGPEKATSTVQHKSVITIERKNVRDSHETPFALQTFGRFRMSCTQHS